jgi:hypothetical protein
MTITSTPNKTARVYGVRNLSPADEKRILDHLQTCVDAWCSTPNAGWFGLRDLMGGANRDWRGTDLQVLYDRHAARFPNPRDAERTAAVDGGRLLKRVLEAHKREFESEKGYRTAVYRPLS